MGISKIFKPYILNSGGYKGGKAAKGDGRKLYKLSSNENFHGTSQAVSKIICESVNQLNIYPSATPAPLYDALERHYDGELSNAQFIAGNSGSELIQIINQAFLDPSKNAIISNPCFAPYKMFSEWTGGRIKDIRLLEPDYSVDIKGILSAVDPNTRLIFLTSPNNPTGTYIPRPDLQQILEGIPDHVIVVYDEVYNQFVEANDYSTALPFVQSGYPVIGINSFSKAYGLAGLRVGYGYTTPVIAKYLRKLIRPFLINQVSMVAAITALEDQQFLKEKSGLIKDERKRLQQGLKSMNIQTWPSQGNFVLINPGIDEKILTQKMYEHDIMVRPTHNFGAPGCVRITIGDREATDHILSTLATILQK